MSTSFFHILREQRRHVANCGHCWPMSWSGGSDGPMLITSIESRDRVEIAASVCCMLRCDARPRPRRPAPRQHKQALTRDLTSAALGSHPGRRNSEPLAEESRTASGRRARPRSSSGRWASRPRDRRARVAPPRPASIRPALAEAVTSGRDHRRVGLTGRRSARGHTPTGHALRPAPAIAPLDPAHGHRPARPSGARSSAAAAPTSHHGCATPNPVSRAGRRRRTRRPSRRSRSGS